MISKKKSRKRSTVLITPRTKEMTGATATVDLIVLRKSILTGMATTGAVEVKRNQIVMGRVADMTHITEIAAGAAVGTHKGGIGLRKKMKDTTPQNRVIGAGAEAENVGRLKAGAETITLAKRVAGIAAEAAAHVDENKSFKEHGAKSSISSLNPLCVILHFEWPSPFNHSSLKNMNSG